jgi:hypothetical protein
VTLAPIALFVYNRPQHTAQTVEALQRNDLAKESHLYIFADAPRNPDTKEGVLAVRQFIRTITGFKSVTIAERDRNYGLADSIIDGVTRLCDAYGQVIVVEDDLVTSPFFLLYMNQALELYCEEERVISIHGYSYPMQAALPESYFIRGADCWGWATWKRGWDLFEPDGSLLLAELTRLELTALFDFSGAAPFTKMLRNQCRGRNNSWAIRWYASAFLADKLTLYPGVSLVRNIGVDGTGEHCSATSSFDCELSSRPISLRRIAPCENGEVRSLVEGFLRSVRLPLLNRIKNKLRKLMMKHAGPRNK